MKIGMVVAVELEAVLELFGAEPQILDAPAFQVRCYELSGNQLFVVHCGAGEIASAAATQFLITKFETELIVNFGVVGGLTPQMKAAHSCVVKSVVHYDFDVSAVNHCPVGKYSEEPQREIMATPWLLKLAVELEPSLKPVVCASADKFIASEEQKKRLHEEFGADICEMEAAGILLTCRRNRVPCLMIKSVADSITGGPQEFHREFDRAARQCFEILMKIVERAEKKPFQEN